MRSAEKGIKNLFRVLSAMIVVLFLSSLVRAAIGDYWNASNGVGTRSWSWMIPGPKSAVVTANTAYAGDLIPGLNNTYNVGSANYTVKNVFASNLTVVNSTTTSASKPFQTVNLNTTQIGTENLAITNLTANITVNISAPTAGASFDVFSAAGNVGVQGNVTINATSGTTINGAASVTFTNTANNAWPRATLHGFNTTVWQVSY